MELVFKAMSFAERKHRGQVRKYSDSPYVLHPFRVAYRVQNYSKWTKVTDDNQFCAALLHDTLEDTDTTYQELEREFNQDVAFLVLELTQPDKLDKKVKDLPRIERHKLLLEKLKTISLRAKQIKYWDRFDNLSETDLSNQECYGFMKRRYLQESFDIVRVLDLFNDELTNLIYNLATKCKVNLI